MNNKNDVRVSMKLSSILCRQETQPGVHVRPDGYVAVSDLLALPTFREVTLDTIREIVRLQPNRFTLLHDSVTDTWLIQSLEKRRDQTSTTSSTGRPSSRGFSRTRHTRPQTTNHDVNLSRKLSSVLRHRATELGLEVRSDGYISVAALLKLPTFRNVTMEAISHVVQHNDKQRFALLHDSDTNTWFIRANQGHSMTEIVNEELLTPIQSLDQVPSVCIHGTTHDAWLHIRQEGLSRQCRRHIHMATGLDVISGVRKSSQVLIYIDAMRILCDGRIPLFRSDNDVILSPGLADTGCIPVEYFDHVVDRRSGEILYQTSLKPVQTGHPTKLNPESSHTT